jgi:hypothetical protein
MSGPRRWLGGLSEGGEEAGDALGGGDDRAELHATVALGEVEDVDRERPAKQLHVRARNTGADASAQSRPPVLEEHRLAQTGTRASRLEPPPQLRPQRSRPPCALARTSAPDSAKPHLSDALRLGHSSLPRRSHARQLLQGVRALIGEELHLLDQAPANDWILECAIQITFVWLAFHASGYGQRPSTLAKQTFAAVRRGLERGTPRQPRRVL